MLSLVKVAIPCFLMAFAIYFYIHAHNHVIELRLQIPQKQKEVNALKAEYDRLHYEIDQFESPLHLMELSKKPEFSHLKAPFLKEVILIPYTKVIDE